MKKFRLISTLIAIAIFSLASCDCGNEKSVQEIAQTQEILIAENECAITAPDTVSGYMQRNTGGYSGPVHYLKSGRTLNSTTRRVESQAVIKNGKMADGTGKLYVSSCRIDRFPSGYNSENHHFIALGKIII